MLIMFYKRIEFDNEKAFSQTMHVAQLDQSVLRRVC